MGWKKYAAMGVIASSMLGGGYLGRMSALDREYRIVRNRGDVALNVISTERTYPIIPFDGEIYVGDSEHHLRGVQAAARYEGRTEMQPTIDRLQSEVSNLETKIAMRRLTDQLESIGDSIRSGWRNFKHNTLK